MILGVLTVATLLAIGVCVWWLNRTTPDKQPNTFDLPTTFDLFTSEECARLEDFFWELGATQALYDGEWKIYSDERIRCSDEDNVPSHCPVSFITQNINDVGHPCSIFHERYGKGDSWTLGVDVMCAADRTDWITNRDRRKYIRARMLEILGLEESSALNA